jgi:hypothetical protein
VGFCGKAGDDFQLDRKHLGLRFSCGIIIQFVTHRKFYDDVYLGNSTSASAIIGEYTFDKRLDEAEAIFMKGIDI